MIPAYDDLTGNLPPGIHETSWEEFAERFGFNAKRKLLLQYMAQALDHLRLAGCQIVYIDGSFVTRKTEPNDYDICISTIGLDAEILRLFKGLIFESEAERSLQKQVYRGDIFPAMTPAVNQSGQFVAMLEYFQEDQDGNRKGIMMIRLGSDHDTEL